MAGFHRPNANKKRRKRGAFFESSFNRQPAASHLNRPGKTSRPGLYNGPLITNHY